MDDKILAVHLFNCKKNAQTFNMSWGFEFMEDNAWEKPTHKKFLNVAQKMLEITDLDTAIKIAELGLFMIE